ncbi:MAG: hypothetical protein ACYST9_01740 [Planctomycetota bacterium]|jgi:hypothetical protein
MFNIFEQPWTLLITAVVLLLVTWVIRDTKFLKKHWYLWLLPFFLAGSAFALDHLIATDHEQISLLTKTAIKAIEEENTPALVTLISDNYRDSHHPTKSAFVSYFRELLSEPLIEKNTTTATRIELSPPQATVTIVVWTTFDRHGWVYQYKQMQLTKAKLTLQKEQTKWLINRIDIIEVDKRPASWGHLR